MDGTVFLVVMALSGSGDMEFNYHQMPNMEVCQECVKAAKIKIPEGMNATEFKSSTIVSSSSRRNRGKNGAQEQSANQATYGRNQSSIAMYCAGSTARKAGKTAW
jgi:hypothetical protein